MKLELYPYIVPLVDKDGKLEVNWALIENIQNYIQTKIMDIVFINKTKETIRKNYNVDPAKKEEKNTSAFGNSQSLGIWDDKFTGVRYVKLNEFRSALKWDLPTLHLEKRAQG